MRISSTTTHGDTDFLVRIISRYYTGGVLTPMMGFTWITMFLLYWRIWKEASTHAKRLRDKNLYNDVPSDWKSVQVKWRQKLFYFVKKKKKKDK